MTTKSRWAKMTPEQRAQAAECKRKYYLIPENRARHREQVRKNNAKNRERMVLQMRARYYQVEHGTTFEYVELVRQSLREQAKGLANIQLANAYLYVVGKIPGPIPEYKPRRKK